MSLHSFAVWLRTLLGGVLLAFVLGACAGGPCIANGSGCTGGGGPPPPPPPPPPPTITAPTLVNLADAAADRVLALQLKISDITLNQTTGAKISVVNNAAGITVELTHRAALNEPINLSLNHVAAGTYNSLTITLASAAVTYVDDLGVTQQDPAATLTTTTVNLTLPAQVTVNTSTPLVLDLVFQPSSVAIDTILKQATITPTFVVALTPAPAASSTETEADGRIRVLTGVVVGTPGPGITSFTLSASQLANPIKFSTDAGTTFSGDISAFGGITGNNILQVQSETQPNGDMLAKTIDGENAGVGLTTGGDFEGVVAKVLIDVGSPFNVNTITLRVQNSATTGVAPVLGSAVTINNFTAPTVFLVDTQDVDLTNLSFTPSFDLVHVRPPQVISAIYPVVATTTAPKKLKLRLQTLAGTVQATSNGTVANQQIINFTPPTDSLFVLLTGQTSLTVVQQPTTDISLAVPTPGNPLHVRGLLFFDTVSGNYFLIADQFTP